MSVPGSVAFQLDKQQKPFGKFLQGEPKLLGISLIMFAGMQFGLGFAIHFGAKSMTADFGVNWWLSLTFLVSGILAVVCAEYPDKPRVTACLAMNIVTALLATLGLFFLIVYTYAWLIHVAPVTDREERHRVLNLGLTVFLMLVSVAGLVLNATVSVFCCRGLRYCRPSSSAPVVVVSAPLSDHPTVVSN